MKRPAVIIVFSSLIFLVALGVSFFFFFGDRDEKPTVAEDSGIRALEVPAKPRGLPGSDRWDAIHYVGLLTEPYGTVGNPYAPQTLFRGDVEKWESNSTVLVDVKSDTVRVKIPDTVNVFCYPTKNAKGEPMREQSIGLLPQLRDLGAASTNEKVRQLFPDGAENMLVAADVIENGDKIAYLIMHIGCKDSNYPVKIP